MLRILKLDILRQFDNTNDINDWSKSRKMKFKSTVSIFALRLRNFDKTDKPQTAKHPTNLQEIEQLIKL
jgi:hypothetical protein